MGYISVRVTRKNFTQVAITCELYLCAGCKPENTVLHLEEHNE